MSDLLSDLGGLLSTDELGNEDFLNELSYYGSLDYVSIEDEVSSIYNRKLNIATNAQRIIKSDKHTIKGLSKGIEDSEFNYKREFESLSKLRYQKREAKKEWKNTIPFTKKAKEAHQKFKDSKQQISYKTRELRRMKERIQEDKASLVEKEIEIKEQTTKLQEAKDYMAKLEKGIRAQFRVVDKILATRDFYKNQANINPNLSQTTKNSIQQLNGIFNNAIDQDNNPKSVLKISIRQPLKYNANYIASLCSNIEQGIQQSDKDAITQSANQNALECKKYVQLVSKDPCLENLDLGNNGR